MFDEGLDMLNRAALLLRYKDPAVRWINAVDPNPSAMPVTVEDVNSERTVYLISDEDADSSDGVRNWVEANFRALLRVSWKPGIPTLSCGRVRSVLNYSTSGSLWSAIPWSWTR